MVKKEFLQKNQKKFNGFKIRRISIKKNDKVKKEFR